MVSVGERIKRKRLEREMTLDQLSNNTKIPVRALESIECGRFSDLPNDIVVRGFIKSICQVLGLDDKSYIGEYEGNRVRLNGNVGKTLPSSAGEVLKPSTGKYRFVLALIVFLLFGGLLLLVVFTPSTIRGSDKLTGSVERVAHVEK